jgi:outer membrane biosynthesis protein TonB
MFAAVLAVALGGAIVAVIVMSRPQPGNSSRIGAAAWDQRSGVQTPDSAAAASPARTPAEPARPTNAPEIRPPASTPSADLPPNPAPAPRPSPELMQAPIEASPVPAPPTPPRDKRKAPAQPNANQAQPAETVVPLPVARDALALVGADPDAEEVWFQAINDPNFTAKQREDLIEDLNEVGIDPKNLTEDDIPLIVSRMQIIEELAPDAMDEVNAAAFAEAYKDLANMLVRAMRQ